MRPMSLFIPASLLALASGASAQTVPTAPPDPSAISSVQVTAPAKTIRIREDQAYQIGGTYAMSNGWYLKVRPAKRHIDATIDNDKQLRLLAVAPYKFVSADGNVAMEFNLGSYGDDMVMSYVPDPRLAQRVVISSAPLAQR